ncbi:MAG: hypothetical protein AAGB97_07990 [Dehalococcoidia bacterium]
MRVVAGAGHEPPRGSAPPLGGHFITRTRRDILSTSEMGESGILDYRPWPTIRGI